MKNLPSMLAAGALLVVLVLYMCTYQVRSTEVAVRKTFGKADQVITDPGLKFKWPWPIQGVVKYDKRLRVLFDEQEETRTSDSKNIILATYTVWTIADPAKFHESYPNEEEGARALRTKIRATKLAVTGKHAFSEFVSTDEAERRLQPIEEEMRQAIASDAKKQFGVEIRSFGIKQLGLPEEVTKAVFMAMTKSEESKAKIYLAEGKAKAQEIEANAVATQQRILASAKRKVDTIEADAEQEVGRIYVAFRGHEGLRMYLDKLDALERIMADRATLILGLDRPPFDLFDSETRLESVLRGDVDDSSSSDPIPDNVLGE